MRTCSRYPGQVDNCARICKPSTVYRVLNAMVNYCDFPDLKQIAVKRMHFQIESYISIRNENFADPVKKRNLAFFRHAH